MTPGRTVAGGGGLTSGRTALISAASGLTVANIYYAQPLIGLIAPALGLQAELAGLVMTLTQAGFGLGLLLLGMAFLGVGVLASSLTENQIVAAVSAFGVLLLLWVIGWSTEAAGPTLGPILSHLSIINHYDNYRFR